MKIRNKIKDLFDVIKYKRQKNTFENKYNSRYETQGRIDKAIEYIGNGNIGIPRKTRDKFIAILKGEDKGE